MQLCLLPAPPSLLRLLKSFIHSCIRSADHYVPVCVCAMHVCCFFIGGVKFPLNKQPAHKPVINPHSRSRRLIVGLTKISRGSFHKFVTHVGYKGASYCNERGRESHSNKIEKIKLPQQTAASRDRHASRLVPRVGEGRLHPQPDVLPVIKVMQSMCCFSTVLSLGLKRVNKTTVISLRKYYHPIVIGQQHLPHTTRIAVCNM